MSKTKDMAMDLRQQETDERSGFSPIPQAPSVQVSMGFKALVSMDAAMIDTLARAQVNEVADGNVDAAKLFALGQKISLLGTTIVDNVKQAVYGKTYATKGETYTIDGVELSPAELGVKYDYASTNDPQWIDLNVAFEAAKKAKEEREKFLKTIKGSLTIAVESTGEMVTISEPIKSGQSGYKCKIK